MSLVQENKLSESAIEETFFFPATQTDAGLNLWHSGVKVPTREVLWLLWSNVRVEGRRSG